MITLKEALDSYRYALNHARVQEAWLRAYDDLKEATRNFSFFQVWRASANSDGNFISLIMIYDKEASLVELHMCNSAEPDYAYYLANVGIPYIETVWTSRKEIKSVYKKHIARMETNNKRENNEQSRSYDTC